MYTPWAKWPDPVVPLHYPRQRCTAFSWSELEGTGMSSQYFAVRGSSSQSWKHFERWLTELLTNTTCTIRKKRRQKLLTLSCWKSDRCTIRLDCQKYCRTPRRTKNPVVPVVVAVDYPFATTAKPWQGSGATPYPTSGLQTLRSLRGPTVVIRSTCIFK